MMYFNSIPKILTPDVNGDGIVMTNLMVRTELIPALINNSEIFYKYDIQDGDTPEIVADKYYGDSYRYWIVLYANQILDPQWNWPLNNQQFDAYMVKKYTAAANTGSVLSYTQSTVKEYRIIINTIDTTTLVEKQDVSVVDITAYNKPVNPSKKYTVSSGRVTQTKTKQTVSIYDYELEQNESKRTINLIDKIYVSELEQQFKSLMSR